MWGWVEERKGWGEGREGLGGGDKSGGGGPCEEGRGTTAFALLLLNPAQGAAHA